MVVVVEVDFPAAEEEDAMASDVLFSPPFSSTATSITAAATSVVWSDSFSVVPPSFFPSGGAATLTVVPTAEDEEEEVLFLPAVEDIVSPAGTWYAIRFLAARPSCSTFCRILSFLPPEVGRDRPADAGLGFPVAAAVVEEGCCCCGGRLDGFPLASAPTATSRGLEEVEEDDEDDVVVLDFPLPPLPLLLLLPPVSELLLREMFS